MIGTRLFFSRLLGLTALLLLVYLFRHHGNDYAYALVLLLLFPAAVPLSGLQLYIDKIRVKQYFFFGFIPRTILFQKQDDVSVYAFEIELNDPSTWSDMESASTNPLILQRFALTQKDEIGKVKKKQS